MFLKIIAPYPVVTSAQGFIAFVTLGVGMFLGGILAGKWSGRHTLDGVMNWPAIWQFPALLSAGVLILFFVFFQDRSTEKTS